MLTKFLWHIFVLVWMVRSSRVPVYELNILTQILNIRIDYFLEYFIFWFLRSIVIASTNVIIIAVHLTSFLKKIFRCFETSPACLSQFDNRKWGSLSSRKAKVKGVLIGCFVAMEPQCYIKNDRNMFTNDWAFCEITSSWHHLLNNGSIHPCTKWPKERETQGLKLSLTPDTVKYSLKMNRY